MADQRRLMTDGCGVWDIIALEKAEFKPMWGIEKPPRPKLKLQP